MDVTCGRLVYRNFGRPPYKTVPHGEVHVSIKGKEGLRVWFHCSFVEAYTYYETRPDGRRMPPFFDDAAVVSV